MFINDYYNNTIEILDKIYSEEADAIQQTGKMLAEVFSRDGLLHVFGCGHSHMIEEELFFRAGGLAQVNPIYQYNAA